MTGGADGRVWFVKDGFGGPAVGRIDPASGAFTTFMSGLNGAFTLFGGIALGGDGNVWFTSYYDGLIGRVTPAGVITEFTGVAPNAQLNAITAGPQIAGAEHALGHRPDQQEHRQADAALAPASWPAHFRSCA